MKRVLQTIFAWPKTFHAAIFLAAFMGITSCNPTKRIKEHEYLLTEYKIEGNPWSISKTDIESYIKQKPNRKIIGLRFHLWLYNRVNAEKVIAKRIEMNKQIDEENKIRAHDGKKLKSKDRLTFAEWLMDIGESPVVYDSMLTVNSTKQIKLFLNSKGYFNSHVTDSVKLKKKRAIVYYKIKAEKPYTINNIEFNIEDQLMKYYVLADTNECLIERGNNFDIETLQKERERINKTLKNVGYYNFSPDYVYYKVDSNLLSNKINITLGIKKFATASPAYADSIIETDHARYYINNIFIYTEYNPITRDNGAKDTLIVNDVHILYNKTLKYKPELLLNALLIHKRELYQLQNAEDTYKRFSETKAFKQINMNFTDAKSQKDYLDCHIYLSPVIKQSYVLDAEGTNTSGNLGVSGSLVYENRNLLKGAEILEVRIKGGIEAQKLINETQDIGLPDKAIPFNTVEIGPEVNLKVPRPLFPFNYFKYGRNANPKSILTTGYNFQNRPDYKRNILNLGYSLTYKESEYQRYTFFPIEISLVKVQLQPDFEQKLQGINDLILLNRFTDHLTTDSRYTYVYNNQDLRKRKNYTYFKANIESSGNILRGLYSLSGEPKDADGSYRMFNIKFSQYLRADADFRHYYLPATHHRLVVRAYAGLGQPLRNNLALPIEKSFYAGGPNSVRAWRARSVGPGSFKPLTSSRYIQAADIQLEGNLEYRFFLFRVVNGALFADIGNIWLLKADSTRLNGNFELDRFYNEFAVSAGSGIRLDFSFFILRLDMGVKIKDPQFDEGSRWVITHLFDPKWKNEFQQTYGQGYSFIGLNLGIGYPF